MKKIILKNKGIAGAVGICLLIGVTLLSFQDTPFVNQILNEQESVKDTVPLNKQDDKGMTMKQFDQLIETLDRNLIGVSGKLNKTELENIRQQAEISLRSIDIEKIMKDVELSLKQVNVEKILANVTSSLRNIDLNKT